MQVSKYVCGYVVILSIVVLTVVMLSVIMLAVVAPKILIERGEDIQVFLGRVFQL